MDQIDFNLTDNEDLTWPVQFVDEVSGLPHDFSGSTFKMEVKTSAQAGSAEYALTTANGRIVSDNLAQAELSLVFKKGEIAVGDYVYDLIRVNGAKDEKLLAGKISVTKGVTP